MKWVDNFDLFLFDFDGLLVNTEYLHYLAYINMIKNRGYDLDWDFETFCSIAHTSQEGLRLEIYKKFQKLYEEASIWDLLYDEKKVEYLSLLQSANVELMPGVYQLLTILKDKNKKSCVVTNSLREHIDIVLKNNPILNNINNWVTREDYKEPKPSGECYFKAIDLYGKKGDRIIGFEDTIKGIKALSKTHSKCLLINTDEKLNDRFLIGRGVLHVDSFEAIPEKLSY